LRAPILVCGEGPEDAEAYVQALLAGGVRGGRIRSLTPPQPLAGIEALAAGAAGLLLCGGPDLEPWRYGEEPRIDAKLTLFPELDELEMRLLTGAREGRTPVWAICRGLQTINVFLGGTLWQDLPGQRDGAVDHDLPYPRDILAHRIEVAAVAERFGELLAPGPTPVNSRHHQGIKDLGAGLRAVAHSPDGLVEVVSHTSPDWWLKGVQWHPENLLHQPLQRSLWSEFLSAADRREQERGPRLAAEERAQEAVESVPAS